MSLIETTTSGETLADIATVVHQAKQTIMRAIQDEPDRGWTLQDFIDIAPADLADAEHTVETVMSIALYSLVEQGDLRADEMFVIHLGPKTLAAVA